MTLKLLIIDSDITFAISIKRALDQTGDYQVTVFGTSSAGTEYLRQEPQDGVVLDYNLADVSIAMLIRAIRSIQPTIPIVVTPRNKEQQTQLSLLDVQGSIIKPYYARQLIPVMRDALLAKDKPAAVRPPATPPSGKPAREARLGTPPPLMSVSGEGPGDMDLNVPPNSPDFDAAIASLPSLIVEPPVAPDDTFRRHLAAMLPDKPATPAGLRKVLESVEMSTQGMSAEATIADVVNGKPLTDPGAALLSDSAANNGAGESDSGAPIPLESARDNLPEMPPRPEVVPEAPVDPEESGYPSLAEAALDAMDTMPAQGFTLEKFAEAIEQTSGMPVPDWVRDSAEQTASFEPSFVKAAIDAAPPSTAELTTPRAGGLEADEDSVNGEIGAKSIPQTARAAEGNQAERADALDRDAADPVSERSQSFDDDASVTSTPLAPAHTTIDPLAQIAATLTQLAVGSAARATLLTLGESVLAAAGDLPPDTAQGIARVIAAAWKGGEAAGNTLVRYITVPGMGDFLLYSAVGLQGTWLSMLFPSETPLRAIRKHARALLDALEKSDQEPQDALPTDGDLGAASNQSSGAPDHEAARTLLSRPTDFRPPEGLRQTIQAIGDREGGNTADGLGLVSATAVPQVLYSVLLAPRTGMFTPEVFALVSAWLTNACLEHGIHIEGVDAQPTFMSFQVGLGPTDAPNTVIRTIMDASEDTANGPIWADGYYIASSNRALTQQEITQFLKLQKAG